MPVSCICNHSFLSAVWGSMELAAWVCSQHDFVLLCRWHTQELGLNKNKQDGVWKLGCVRRGIRVSLSTNGTLEKDKNMLGRTMISVSVL